MFRSWTAERRLRQPVWKGLRADRDPVEVRLPRDAVRATPAILAPDCRYSDTWQPRLPALHVQQPGSLKLAIRVCQPLPSGASAAPSTV